MIPVSMPFNARRVYSNVRNVPGARPLVPAIPPWCRDPKSVTVPPFTVALKTCWGLPQDYLKEEPCEYVDVNV